MNETRRQLIVTPLESTHPEIGRWLWTLEDIRRMTNAVIDTLPDAAIIDWKPDWALHSIGTLLYHIALVEADWLYVEVLELPEDRHYPGEMGDLFPYPMRTNNALTSVTGISLDEHRTRLAKTRHVLLDTFSTMSLEEFRRVRVFPDYDVTPEWVVYHLIEHEIPHRAEIEALVTQYKKQTGA